MVNNLKIYNLKDRQEFINEIAYLTQLEWGKIVKTKKELEEKVQKKINKIKSNFNNDSYCKLILLENNKLVGFISIFPQDGDERTDLSPWYSTMYVKQEYRKKGYSRILNNAILEEARKRNYKKIYLKTNLKNYYEKFGAKFIEKLKNGENLYYFDL